MVHIEDVEELRAIVRADLAHLHDTWRQGMDLHVIRREAPLLRRLLVDNGGDIQRLWRADGRPGQPMIPDVFDLDSLPTWRGLGLATADTVDLGGLEMSSLILWRDELITDEIKAALNDEGASHAMTLHEYLRATSVVLNERGVRRDDLICYVANRRGGNHFDRRGKKGNPRRLAAYELLDGMSDTGFRINHQDAVFATLVTVVRNLVQSPDLRALAD